MTMLCREHMTGTELLFFSGLSICHLPRQLRGLTMKDKMLFEGLGSALEKWATL